jgi:hypothetical protein
LKRIHAVLLGGQRYVSAGHFVGSVLAELRRGSVVALIT